MAFLSHSHFNVFIIFYYYYEHWNMNRINSENRNLTISMIIKMHNLVNRIYYWFGSMNPNWKITTATKIKRNKKHTVEAHLLCLRCEKSRQCVSIILNLEKQFIIESDTWIDIEFTKLNSTELDGEHVNDAKHHLISMCFLHKHHFLSIFVSSNK